MPKEAITLIEACDAHLKLLRESWLEAPESKKARWQALMDKALDERSHLMRIRDAKPAPTKIH